MSVPEDLPAPRVAAILAGGRSERMGSEKALLAAAGVTLLEHLLERLRPRFEELWISVAASGPSPGLSEAIERARERLRGRLVVVPDRREAAGPLAGVEAILEIAEARGLEHVLVIGVDTPSVDERLLDLLLSSASRPGVTAAAPRWSGGVEPTCAVYGRLLLPAARHRLGTGLGSLRGLLEEPGVVLVDLEAPRAQAVLGATSDLDPGRLFRNINTPGDHRAWLEEERRR